MDVYGNELRRREHEAKMSEKAIEFLQEFITERVQVRPVPAKIEQETEILAKECAAQAAEAGVPIEDIEEEVGDLEELMTTKLEDAVEAEQNGKSG